MRVRMILALVATASTGLGVYTACGGDDSTTAKDAGPDTSADTSIADTSVADVADTSIPCIDADISKFDAASIDAGAFGPCLDCFRTNCSSAVTACNASCKCKNDIVSCVTDPMTCPTVLASDFTDPGVLAILGCVTGPCKGVCQGDGGTDSGVKDASGDGG